MGRKTGTDIRTTKQLSGRVIRGLEKELGVRAWRPERAVDAWPISRETFVNFAKSGLRAEFDQPGKLLVATVVEVARGWSAPNAGKDAQGIAKRWPDFRADVPFVDWQLYYVAQDRRTTEFPGSTPNVIGTVLRNACEELSLDYARLNDIKERIALPASQDPFVDPEAFRSPRYW